MSDIRGELALVRGAYEEPTLTLLHQRHAPTIVAIFRSSFGRDARTVVAARLHDQVDAYLDELRQAGHGELPEGAGRSLCLKWMKGRWLIRTEEDGTEMYALTSHAQDALAVVKGLTRDRATLSEHKIATIVSAVRRFNTDVNPDRATRVSILNSEIAKLVAERDNLLAGGELPQVSPEYMLEGYVELLGLVAGLPGDFARVEEAFVKLRADILASFRAEDRPAGEVIDDYLRRADSLMTATPEGRAFEGAFALLRDDELLHQLREDLRALLEHPQAEDILASSDERELRGTVPVIRRGIESVLAQRTRVTSTLRDYIVTHDITRDRELDSTLRQIDAELDVWMRTAGVRASVPLQLLPDRASITHLRERFHKPGDDKAPPPLHDVSADRPPALTLRELMMQGGPTLAQLRAALDAAMSDLAGAGSMGELFDTLAPELRRPVEIFGLLHLATNHPELTSHEDRETYRALRPDGTSRDLAVPRIAPPAHQPAPLADPGPHDDLPVTLEETQ